MPRKPMDDRNRPVPSWALRGEPPFWWMLTAKGQDK
jgi:hypothetical protein